MKRRRLINLIIIGVLSFLFINVLYLRSANTKTFLGYRTFLIVSESMSPTIQKNALVTIKKVNTYKVGDIIAFVSPEINQVVVHRINQINENMFISKGDANENCDNLPLFKENIIGKCIKINNKISVYISFVKRYFY